MRRRHLLSTIALALCATLWTTQGHAVLLAHWTFETSVPTTAGPHAAELGLNAGVGSPATGFHTSGSVVYSNPVGNGSTESFSSNFWSTGDYYQFRTSTVGYQSISIAWHQTRSATGPSDWQLQWSTDGSSFTSLGAYAVGTTPWSSMTPDIGISIHGPTAGPAALDNQATAYFRLVDMSATSPTAGTSRVDNFQIRGNEIPATIPEPSTLLLVGLGGLLVCLKRLS